MEPLDLIIGAGVTFIGGRSSPRWAQSLTDGALICSGERRLGRSAGEGPPRQGVARAGEGQPPILA
jgi:hypothetical protein